MGLLKITLGFSPPNLILRLMDLSYICRTLLIIRTPIYSEPDKKGIDKKLGVLATEFKDLVFPVGYDPAAQGNGKRKVN